MFADRRAIGYNSGGGGGGGYSGMYVPSRTAVYLRILPKEEEEDTLVVAATLVAEDIKVEVVDMAAATSRAVAAVDMAEEDTNSSRAISFSSLCNITQCSIQIANSGESLKMDNG